MTDQIEWLGVAQEITRTDDMPKEAAVDPWKAPDKQSEDMPFLDLMHVLFELQKKFPDMDWHTGESGEHGKLHLHLTISKENARLLEQGRELFRS